MKNSGVPVGNKKGMVELGMYLKRKREISGLSQARVASILGYSSPQFVSNFERGLCSPPMKKLLKLVELYEIAPEEITELLMELQKRYLYSVFMPSRQRRRYG